MHPGGNKAVVGQFFSQGLGELSPDVVDQVFAPEHRLSSPEFGIEPKIGTQIIKDIIEDFRNSVGDLTCTIEGQIEEGDWVATSYTLREEQDEHMGIMLSRIVDGKIQESHVVAKTVSGPQEEGPMAAARFTTLRQAFN